MKKKNWNSLDFFMRKPDDAIYLWSALGDIRGSLVLPSSLETPSDDLIPFIEKMTVLNRDVPIMVCSEADLQYVRKRSQSRPVFLVEGKRIRVLTSEGVDAILEKNIESIHNFFVSKNPPLRKIEKVNGESVGILYMCFGAKAAKEIRKSMSSLHEVGLEMRVCVVGDTRVEGAQFIEWEGESPFDKEQAKNFQFRAGRIKPYLIDYSPFERTLYLDADTEMMNDILPGFDTLSDFDMAVTEEPLSLGQLYNKKLAGWEINMVERDATIEELGGDAKRKFINSGVIFFKKSPKAKETFAEWGMQWMQYQQWDEQLALMRAMNVCKGNYKYLSVDWNNPHRDKAKIIFHNYGRGVARMNVS